MFERDHMPAADFNRHKAKGNTLHLLLSTLVINLLGLAMPLMMLQLPERTGSLRG